MTVPKVLRIILLALLISCAGCQPMTKIQKASLNGSMTKVDALLVTGADVNEFSSLHGTPLSIAAGQGNREMALHLLAQGADIDLGSPLAAAAWNGHAEMVILLLEQGADVNNGGPAHGSPLESAVRENRADMVALLLASQANPDGAGEGVPLWLAAYRGYNDVVRQLLKGGANPNLHDCLNVAVRHSSSAATTLLLLEHGAEVNAPDEQGMTPLHFAALYGRTERVRFLLQYGANPKLKDRSGKTAESYAREQDYGAIEEMLL